MTLAQIHAELVCELDRLHDAPPKGPDLYLEFIAANFRTLVDELHELIAAAGRDFELEAAA
jgi:hypothetical protein